MKRDKEESYYSVHALNLSELNQSAISCARVSTVRAWNVCALTRVRTYTHC